MAFLEGVVGRAMRRVRRWGRPPRWSRAQWAKEARELGMGFAWEALRAYDPRHGVGLAQFIYWRVLAGVQTRYRQEMAYGGHSDGPDGAEAVPDPRAEDDAASALTNSLLREAVAGLRAPDRWILEQIFGASRTETDVAKELGVRKQSVNERKCKILDAVRVALDGDGQEATQ